MPRTAILARVVAVAVASLAGCGRDAPPPAPTPAPVKAAAAADPAPSTPAVGLPGSTNLAPLAGLGAHLASEAGDRPGVEVPAERVFASVAAAGWPVLDQKQVLAATAIAAYCAHGHTADNVVIAVCEYPTPAAAQAGRALLDRRYRALVPGAVRVVNGRTLVTIANARAHREIERRVVEVVRSL